MAGDVVFGVDVGGTRTKYGLVSLESGEVLSREVLPTERDDSEAFLDQLVCAAEVCLSRGGVGREAVVGVGMGVPGFTDEGVVVSTWGFLRFMEGYPVAQLVEDRLGWRCCVDNDARLVGLAEACEGAGRGMDHVVVLTLGTGIGFAWVQEGKLVGRSPRSHMAGHLPVGGSEERCYCGLKGCFEFLCSAEGLHRRARAGGYSDGEEMMRLGEGGDEGARRVMEGFLGDLVRGLGGYVYQYGPEVIVLAGGAGVCVGWLCESVGGGVGV